MAGASPDAGPDTGPVPSPETLRVRRIWDKMAPGFDKQMRFFERVLFPGAREWACSQANGRVLEIAVGTGRNFSYYPEGVDLSGIEYSPAMLAIAHEKARELGRRWTSDSAMLRRWSSLTTPLTPSCAPFRCARYQMIGRRSTRPCVFSGPEGGSF